MPVISPLPVKDEGRLGTNHLIGKEKSVLPGAAPSGPAPARAVGVSRLVRCEGAQPSTGVPQAAPAMRIRRGVPYPPRATRSISSRTSLSTSVGRLLSSQSCNMGRSISSAISSKERRRLAANASDSSPKAAAT